MVLCDYDCFNCQYDDCIQPYNSLTGDEKRLSKSLDEEVLGIVRKDRKEYMRKYQREYYHGIRRKKKVRRIGENEEVIFNGVTEAAKSVGGCPSAITNCCRGVRPTGYGYRWEYV